MIKRFPTVIWLYCEMQITKYEEARAFAYNPDSSERLADITHLLDDAQFALLADGPQVFYVDGFATCDIHDGEAVLRGLEVSGGANSYVLPLEAIAYKQQKEIASYWDEWPDVELE